MAFQWWQKHPLFRAYANGKPRLVEMVLRSRFKACENPETGLTLSRMRYDRPVEAPKANLIDAQKAIEMMVSANSFEQYWFRSGGVAGDTLEKVWVKVERTCVPIQAKFQPWQGRFQEAQKERYVVSAIEGGTRCRHAFNSRFSPDEQRLSSDEFCQSHGGYIEHLHIGGNGEIREYRGDPRSSRTRHRNRSHSQ